MTVFGGGVVVLVGDDVVIPILGGEDGGGWLAGWLVGWLTSPTHKYLGGEEAGDEGQRAQDRDPARLSYLI